MCCLFRFHDGNRCFLVMFTFAIYFCYGYIPWYVNYTDQKTIKSILCFIILSAFSRKCFCHLSIFVFWKATVNKSFHWDLRNCHVIFSINKLPFCWHNFVVDSRDKTSQQWEADFLISKTLNFRRQNLRCLPCLSLAGTPLSKKPCSWLTVPWMLEISS